jgi:tripartite ATP-independent transporter DctM subunit
MFGGMLLMLALGLPVAFVLGGVAILVSYFVWGPASIYGIISKINSTMITTMLVAGPLFVFMAYVLEGSGIGESLYEAMHCWMSRLKGGLAAGTVLICTIIAAMSGVSATGTVTMGIIALPHMLERKYGKTMAMGAIMAGGALGPLIPPSLMMVVYGTYAGVSVSKLFLGGVLPGLLLSALFCSYILVRCAFNPALGPPRAERVSWGQKFTSLRGIILPAVLIVAVLGSIFGGIATPTEAAAVGSFGALVCAGVNRRLNWKMIKEASYRTIRVTGMFMWILVAATFFASVYQGLGATELIVRLISTTGASKWAVLGMMQVTFLVLGCFVDALSILMITTPIFLPICTHLNMDPLWYGIVFLVNTEMAYLTPPFGMNLFYMKSVAPKDTTMEEVYKAGIPFVGLQLIGLVLVILIPDLALWLPRLMGK